jgi:dihydroorotase
MNAGSTALRLGLPGIPAMAEEMMIQRDLLIARNTQARYHVAHVSTTGGAAVVRDAKRQGITVTAEVCPHHLLLTEDDVETYDTNYKVNPPLRAREDVEACIAAVADGTVDCLVTDHAPHGREDKETDFQNAPFGLVGLEVALGLFAKALILPGHLDWPGLIGKFTVAPARVLGLNAGTLEVGRSADVVVIDPELDWVVDISAFRSRSRNCPYHGWNLKGRVTHTFVGGILKWALGAENTVAAA